MGRNYSALQEGLFEVELEEGWTQETNSDFMMEPAFLIV